MEKEEIVIYNCIDNDNVIECHYSDGLPDEVMIRMAGEDSGGIVIGYVDLMDAILKFQRHVG